MKKASEFFIPFHESGAHLLDKCLYIPKTIQRQSLLFTWDDPNIFMNAQPLIVEYCSGNGQWIGEMATRFPQYNWIAVERDFARARKIWLRRFRLGLENLFVVFGEASLFTREFLQPSSVQEIFINFPDPWPKRRHAKYRLIQQEFVDDLTRILIKNGSATIVTDDERYSEQVVSCFSAWESAFGIDKYVTDWPDFGESFFQKLWLGKNRTIRYHKYINKIDRGRGI